MRVEFPRGLGPRGPGGRLYDSGRNLSLSRSTGGGGSSSGGRRASYRVIVSGLPASGLFHLEIVIFFIKSIELNDQLT